MGLGSKYNDVPPLFGKGNKRVKWVDGSQAAHDAKRGVRSDKNGKGRFKPAKPDKKAPPLLSSSDKRKLEKIAKKRESGERLTSSDKNLLRSHGYKA